MQKNIPIQCVTYESLADDIYSFFKIIAPILTFLLLMKSMGFICIDHRWPTCYNYKERVFF